MRDIIALALTVALMLGLIIGANLVIGVMLEAIFG